MDQDEPQGTSKSPSPTGSFFNEETGAWSLWVIHPLSHRPWATELEPQRSLPVPSPVLCPPPHSEPFRGQVEHEPGLMGELPCPQWPHMKWVGQSEDGPRALRAVKAKPRGLSYMFCTVSKRGRFLGRVMLGKWLFRSLTCQWSCDLI